MMEKLTKVIPVVDWLIRECLFAPVSVYTLNTKIIPASCLVTVDSAISISFVFLRR